MLITAWCTKSRAILVIYSPVASMNRAAFLDGVLYQIAVSPTSVFKSICTVYQIKCAFVLFCNVNHTHWHCSVLNLLSYYKYGSRIIGWKLSHWGSDKSAWCVPLDFSRNTIQYKSRYIISEKIPLRWFNHKVLLASLPLPTTHRPRNTLLFR